MFKSELGSIQIFFGTVVDTADPQQMLRCRVAIPGKTDQIEIAKLPWYYSWNGVKSLPKVDDCVPVIVFDGNIATAFYGSVLIDGSVETPTNYQDYVEVFKKKTGDSDAQITYTLSNGIEINNDRSGMNINLLKLNMFCGVNTISLTETSITLGNGNSEAMLMGDQTVEALKSICDYIEKLVTMMYAGFQTVWMAATPNPFTSAIGAALSPYIPGEVQMKMLLYMVKSKLNSIQSTKVFNV